MDEIYIHDDCQLESLVIINPTATNDPVASAVRIIDDVYLTSSGTLSFTSLADLSFRISLFDLTGKPLVKFAESQYGEGRHTLECNAISTGIYILKATEKMAESRS